MWFFVCSISRWCDVFVSSTLYSFTMPITNIDVDAVALFLFTHLYICSYIKRVIKFILMRLNTLLAWLVIFEHLCNPVQEITLIGAIFPCFSFPISFWFSYLLNERSSHLWVSLFLPMYKSISITVENTQSNETLSVCYSIVRNGSIFPMKVE